MSLITSPSLHPFICLEKIMSKLPLLLAALLASGLSLSVVAETVTETTTTTTTTKKVNGHVVSHHHKARHHKRHHHRRHHHRRHHVRHVKHHAAAGAAAAGAAGTAAATRGQAMRINISQLNNSGENGYATLTPVGNNQTRVDINVQHEFPTANQPAHIHEGTCANLNPAPKYPLNNVRSGKSSTTVNVPLSTLTSGSFAINIHKSASDIKTYVGCGDIAGGGSPAVPANK